ncbi:MAG: MoaD/ThiS family protein [Phycisphaeraceae bacterium]|nr:MoaD/ThiS family protein [Phycisphaeraceae bacterium]
MTFRVLLFGPFADALRAASVEVALPQGVKATAGTVLASLAEQQPKLRPMLGSAMLAINCERVKPETPVGPADELAVIGLVGGG